MDLNTLNNALFNWCVDVLIYIAEITGTTYEIANIVIFVIGMPGLIIFLSLSSVYFYAKYRASKKIIREIENWVIRTQDY